MRVWWFVYSNFPVILSITSPFLSLFCHCVTSVSLRLGDPSSALLCKSGLRVTCHSERQRRIPYLAHTQPCRCNSHFYKCEKSTICGWYSLLTAKRKFCLTMSKKFCGDFLIGYKWFIVQLLYKFNLLLRY